MVSSGAQIVAVSNSGTQNNFGELDMARLQEKIEEQEDEITSLKKAILEAQKQLEEVDRRASKCMAERDELMAKNRESLELLEKKNAELAAQRGEYEGKRVESEQTIARLQQENTELQPYKRRHTTARDMAAYALNRVIDNVLENAIKYPVDDQLDSTTDSVLQNAATYPIDDLPQQTDEEEGGRRNKHSVCFDLKCISEPRPPTGHDSSSSGTWSTTSNTEHLEETIHHLSGTVNKIIKKSKPDLCVRERSIAELEEQLSQTQREREIERAKRNQEMLNLKQTIVELEKALRNAQIRSDNLKNAVDLYQNSVNVLEASEERARIEISQQRQTIINLQEALVASKLQLNELQQKATSEIHRNMLYINNMKNVLLSVENQRLFHCNEVQTLVVLVEQLRDANLDLEVDNFGYVQDVAMLETRLLKYQHILRSNEGCICGLKKELARVTEENKMHVASNTYLKQTMTAMMCELNTLQMIADESKDTQNFLQKENEDLLHKSEMNQQICGVNGARMEELQHLLGEKTMELNRFSEMHQKTHKKLELALHQNKELKADLAKYLEQSKKFQQETAANDERTGNCQKEMEACKGSMCEMQNHVARMQELLKQKGEQYCKLEAEFRVQKNTCLCLKQQIDGNQAHYENDERDLKHTIQELNDKLTKAENNYHSLHEDYKKSQAKVLELTQREAEFHHGSTRHENDLALQVQALQIEEARLTECVLKLEKEAVILRNELASKNEQLHLSQEETNNLKNDINKFVHRHSKLKSENEALQAEISLLKNCTSRCEQHHQATSEHLDQCLKDLQSVQMERDTVELKNKQLRKELQNIQRAYKLLESTHNQLNGSVVNLQKELIDNKLSRDEICEESRCVITNVRAWLQNQSRINEDLMMKLADDETVIEQLQQKIECMKSKCQCKCRQRGGGVPNQPLGTSARKLNQRMLWSPGSRGSGSASPNSINSLNQDWYEDYEDVENVEDNSLISHCLKKVESINQELRKSNKFWKSKLEDDFLVTKDK